MMQENSNPRGSCGRKGVHLMMDLLFGNTKDAQKFGSVSTKQQQIAEWAEQKPDRVFNSLAHHIDVAWLKRSIQTDKEE